MTGAWVRAARAAGLGMAAAVSMTATVAVAETRPVVQIAVYEREATALAGWAWLEGRMPDAIAGMEPHVVERGRWFTLVGVPVDGDAQSGCQSLRRAGQECFVTEADLGIEAPAIAQPAIIQPATVQPAVPTPPTPSRVVETAPAVAPVVATTDQPSGVGALQVAAFASAEDANRGRAQLAQSLAPVFAQHGGAALSVIPRGSLHLVVARAEGADRLCSLMRQAGRDCFPIDLPGTAVAEASPVEPAVTPAETAAIPTPAPAVEAAVIEESPVAVTEPATPTTAPSVPALEIAPVAAVAPAVPTVTAPSAPAEADNAPGMQLALYNTRAAAERGWSVLSTRFTDLRDQAAPVFVETGSYIALKAVTANAAARDSVCTTLRQRGADCVAETVSLTQTVSLPSSSPSPAEIVPVEVAVEDPTVPVTEAAPIVVANTPTGTQTVPSSPAVSAGPGVETIVLGGTTITVPAGSAAHIASQLGGASIPGAANDAGVEVAALPAPAPMTLRPDLPNFGAGGATTAYGGSPLGPDSIIISIADRKLQYHAPDGTVYVWPVAVGRHTSFAILGDTEITRKRPNPTWVPTPSMRERDPSLPASVGPGPSNPMGAYALNLGFPYIRIHGTNNPDSVGHAASSGCYRMHADAIEFLFNAVSVGTRVRVIDGPLGSPFQVTAAE